MRLCSRLLSINFVRSECRRCVSSASSHFEAPPPHATAVIAGGGIGGLSTLYHLLKAGCKDAVLLDSGKLANAVGYSSGGLFSQNHFWHHKQARRLARYSTLLISELQTKYGFAASLDCGRLLLAQTLPTFLSFQRLQTIALTRKIEATLLSIADLKSKYGEYLKLDDVKGGLFLPTEGFIDPRGVAKALASECYALGGKILENCGVEGVHIKDDVVSSVSTWTGVRIQCKYFVNAAGVWSKRIPVFEKGERMVPSLPSQAVTTAYLIAEPFVKGSSTDSLPIVHDVDANVFASPTSDGHILCGGFREDSTKPISPEELAEYNSREDQSEQWDTFYPILEKITERIPPLTKSKVIKLVNGADAFTPDGYPLIGELPEIANYYVISGFCSHAFSLAIGAGDLLATWMLQGEPGRNVSAIDVARFLPLHKNRRYLRDRTPEVVGMAYRLNPQLHVCQTARNIRRSPVHDELKENGAIFGEIMGYERPLYFDKGGLTLTARNGHSHKPTWFNAVSAEYESCRKEVGLMDMSFFSKFEVTGEEKAVVNYLQRLCSGNIDKPIGSSIFTGMQNVYGQYTAFNLIGPASRSLMQQITDTSVTPHEFPPFSCKIINVGYATDIRAISVTHTGELGWVLYVPTLFAQHVYETIVEAGKEHNLRHVGYQTLRHLRMEKFYVYWGQDIDYMTTPIECGRLFRVDFDKDFIGKEALLKQKEEGVRRRFVQLLLETHDMHLDAWPEGREPIYRNGQYAGLTTTAAYGYTLGCQVLLGYLCNFDAKMSKQIVDPGWVTDKNANYEVMIAGKKHPAKVNLHSPKIPMLSSEHAVHYRPTQ